ncbi:MAG TPA: YceI family protein [Solirubrobacteraceae bacterium]|jgi:polyisoprenoid-binding protein YceI|nr:YceI family protein [Solirubrobacteraceae bacterium]
MTATMVPTETANPIAEPGRWSVDPAHSTVGFEVRDMAGLIATVRGRFTDYEGTLVTGADGEARASGAIRVASVTTDQLQRDEHLRSPQFLDTGRFPEIRFASDRIEPLDGERIRIAGRLQLKGSEEQVELDARVLGSGVDRHGAERIAIAGEGEIGFGPMRVKLVLDVSLTKGE